MKALEGWVQLAVDMVAEKLLDHLKPTQEDTEVLSEKVLQVMAKALECQLEGLTGEDETSENSKRLKRICPWGFRILHQG